MSLPQSPRGAATGIAAGNWEGGEKRQDLALERTQRFEEDNASKLIKIKILHC